MSGAVEDSAENRRRISAALVRLVASRGFRQTTVEDVAAAAGVAPEDFRRHFSDMEEAFLTVWDELTAEHAALMADAYARNPDWRQRMRAMAGLTLEFLRADRDRACFLVLEVLNAGEKAQLRRDLAISGQAALIDEGRALLDDPGSVAPTAAHSAAGAANEVLIRRTRSGELFRSRDEAVRELLYLVVRPYLGHRAALEELDRTASPSARTGP